MSDYDVTATGMSSGAVATTTFTDAAVNVKSSGVASAYCRLGAIRQHDLPGQPRSIRQYHGHG